jgi:hypothetical protein
MTSDTPELQAILHRIETLERENRRLKRLGFLVATLLGLPLLMAQGQWTPKVVGANSFILHDADGKIRATLAFCGRNPCLTLLDASGREEGRLDATGLAAPAFFLTDSKGKIWGGLGITAKGPSLSLCGRNGKEQIGLELAADEPSLRLSDVDGRRRVIATVFEGNPHLWLLDEEEQGRLTLGVNTGQPILELSDNEGFRTAVGSTDLVTPLTGEKHTTSAASFVLLGKDGKVLWSAP